jgi:Glutamine amidotransferase domain
MWRLVIAAWPSFTSTNPGRQPMVSAPGALVTFNGEIYNFREVRLRLESDTEVLPHLYARRGDRMVDDLRGCLHSQSRIRWPGRLLVARGPFSDVFGLKIRRLLRGLWLGRSIGMRSLIFTPDSLANLESQHG